MNLLEKFGSVIVKNNDRIPKEDIDFIKSLEKDYLKTLSNNISILDTLKPLSEIFEHVNRYDSYNYNPNDSINVVKAYISNLHYRYIHDITNYIKSKYNMDIKIDEMHVVASYEVKMLYQSKPKYVDYHGHNRYHWDKIDELTVNYMDVMDFIFDSIGGLDLNDFKINESKQHLNDMYSNDSHRNHFTISNNGVLTLPSFINNPEQHWSFDSTSKTLNSLINLLELVYKESISNFSEKLSKTSLFEFFCVNRPYSKNIQNMYDKYMINDDVVEYLKYFKNGTLKVKFNNKKLANKFINTF